MARKQVHECTKHSILLCPETKFIVDIKKAAMNKTKASINYSVVINQIIEEYGEMKKANPEIDL